MLYNNPSHQTTYEEDEKDKYNCQINDFQIIEKIGTGQFSTVYKVKDKQFEHIYAMKVIEKRPENEKEEQKKQIKREIDNLIKCYHWKKNYNTVFLYRYFETKEQYILIFNYCDTTLENYINENYPNKRMPLEEIKILFLELNQGFKNLYEEKVIHRDIKINNILIEYSCGDKEDIIPRLADFGISRENSTLNNPMTASISWLLLSAPEILLNGTDYSFASDLWSIGVLLYKIAFGKYPYEGNGAVQLYMKIMQGPNNLVKSGDINFDDLINRLLHKDKERRITYEEYFNHPFFKFDEPDSIINFNKNFNTNISLYSREFRIESIEGNTLLESLSNINFIKLKELNLQFCNISNLAPLTNNNFKNLVFLNLQYNNISDLNPLIEIKFLNIKEMYFGFNKIEDISPLEKIHFRCLKKLGLSGNSFKWDEDTTKIYNKIISN